MIIIITAFVGTIEEESDTPISGNGKTGSMVGVAYLDHMYKNKRVWSNFDTDFSERVCGMQEMIDDIGDEPQPDLILLITEMGKILNSLGSSTKKVIYIENFARQLRKLEVDAYYDEQRFKSIHLRLRVFTDIIFIPYKYHMDNEPCNYNLCKKPHKVLLYSYKPRLRSTKPRIIFNMQNVGKHYDTNQICIDQLVLPTNKGE